MHRPHGAHFNLDPHPDREPSPQAGPCRHRACFHARSPSWSHLIELRVACPLCHRQGVYSLEKQIVHGADMAIVDWLLGLTTNCDDRGQDAPEQCAQLAWSAWRRFSGGCAGAAKYAALRRADHETIG